VPPDDPPLDDPPELPPDEPLDFEPPPLEPPLDPPLLPPPPFVCAETTGASNQSTSAKPARLPLRNRRICFMAETLYR